MQALELLAPARTADIGIAAIDCGADAVYIAGPAFGARQAAGNPVADIERLCAYAHRFGARIYVTFNTILYESELAEARRLLQELQAAGVDALIVQDPAVLKLAPEGMVMHASTQCAIRSAEDARFYESLGFGRLVLERQLSLDTVRAVRAAVAAELEFFVHGALCVSYSGNCYLSEYLAGRSANRGACVQACRSLYDLEDSSGKVLQRRKALLSLRDLNLIDRLGELAEAGIVSFKIEGRLKGESYVRNVVRAYSEALDALCLAQPERYRRASFGKVQGGFTPNLAKTFNRGYTSLWLDGQRRRPWSSMDAPTSVGERIGQVERVREGQLIVRPDHPGLVLRNGDGFSFVTPRGEVVGFRGDICEGFTIRCKAVEGLRPGTVLYRNVDAAFEKALEAGRPKRLLPVAARLRFRPGRLTAEATAEDGRAVSLQADIPTEIAENQERMRSLIAAQMGKRAGHYTFSLASLDAEEGLPLLPAAFLNGVRRSLSEQLDALPVTPLPLRQGIPGACPAPAAADYRANIANSLTRSLYKERGASFTEDAYELSHRPGAELMRSKYCVRYELGLCPREHPGGKADPLFLRNNGRRLRLRFDCARCEMVVEEA